MRQLISLLIGFVWVASAFAGSTTLLPLSADTDPDIGPVAQCFPTDDQWDLLFNSEAGITCNDNQLLGVAFAGQHFYISGGNNGLDPNKVYLLNPDGSYYAEFDQWGPPGWGWRELTYDGVYLYACQDNMIYAMDLDGNPVPSMNIMLPFSPASALAYDPVLNHFWVVAGIMLYEITRTGTVLWFSPFSGGAPVGLAWDDAAPDGPWLWMFFQGGSPPTIIQQFDPIIHLLTGFSYQLPLLPGSTNQAAGGLFFAADWHPAYWVLGGLTQGTPEDQIFCLEMYSDPIPQYDVIIELDYVSGSPVPAGGGAIIYDVYIENLDWFPADFCAWINLEYGTQWLTITQRYFEHFGAGCIIDRDSLILTVQPHWPAGDYVVMGCVSSYPYALPWSSSSFTFTKAGAADNRAGFGDLLIDGESGDPLKLDLESAIPTGIFLLDNYPNPFNPTTTICFTLDQSNWIELTVFDVAGREVANLVKGFYQAGHYEVVFNASGLPSGVYIGRLTAAGITTFKKMIMMK